MKKINLLSPEFKNKKIEKSTVKTLLIVITLFLAYTAFSVYGVQQEAAALAPNYEIDVQIPETEKTIEKLEEEIESEAEYLTNFKKSYFPYKEIVEFFAKRTPEGVMIQAVFDQGETLVARGAAIEQRIITQLVNSLESNLEVEDIKVTELSSEEDRHLFELQFKRKVDVDAEVEG